MHGTLDSFFVCSAQNYEATIHSIEHNATEVNDDVMGLEQVANHRIKQKIKITTWEESSTIKTQKNRYLNFVVGVLCYHFIYSAVAGLFVSEIVDFKFAFDLKFCCVFFANNLSQ